MATPRSLMAYFTDFSSGWYALTNTELGFGVGLAWPRAIYPYAWFWQEMHAHDGLPWYKQAYVMAIEPNTSFPASGLVEVAAKTSTQRWPPARRWVWITWLHSTKPHRRGASGARRHGAAEGRLNHPSSERAPAGRSGLARRYLAHPLTYDRS
jgi:hypothetical protein